MSTIKDLIAAAPTLSARPDAMASLMEIIDDPVVGADKLVPIVERDPGLTAGLLKLCNSPAYGYRRVIGSPREALIIVGNLMFARLCFTLSLEPVIHRDLPGYQLDLDTLWQHSLATAYGAAFLMVGMGLGEQRERAFTAGLLHDVGKLVLDAELAGDGDVGEAAAAGDGEKDVTLDLERRRTGFDHAEAGGTLLDSWGLPEPVVAAVRWHHDPAAAGEHKRVAQAVHVADRVSHMAARLQAGSQALENWVTSTFDGSTFAQTSVTSLADTLARKHENILALATNPRL